MEEHLARVEIVRRPSGGFGAIIWSETEGDKEIAAADMEQLLRELTMDLEFVVGQHNSGEGALSAEEEFENLEYAEEWSS